MLIVGMLADWLRVRLLGPATGAFPAFEGGLHAHVAGLAGGDAQRHLEGGVLVLFVIHIAIVHPPKSCRTSGPRACLSVPNALVRERLHARREMDGQRGSVVRGE